MRFPNSIMITFMCFYFPNYNHTMFSLQFLKIKNRFGTGVAGLTETESIHVGSWITAAICIPVYVFSGGRGETTDLTNHK